MAKLITQIDLCFVGSIHTASLNVPDLEPGLFKVIGTEVGHQDGWNLYEVSVASEKFLLAHYRSRVLVIKELRPSSPVSTASFLEHHFIPLRSVFITNLLPLIDLAIGAARTFVWYPVAAARQSLLPSLATIGLTAPQKQSKRWLGDGSTSFFYRIFDSQSGRSGYIRISRFLTICYGLNSELVSEVVNLVYERAIYPRRNSVFAGFAHGELEQTIMNGLAEYTLPTELNIFLQFLVLRASVYLSLLGGGLAIAATLTQNSTRGTQIVALLTAVVFTIFVSTVDSLRRRLR